MKKILIYLLFLSGVANSQTTGYFRYDSVRFEKIGGNSEFILLNSTRNVPGYLYNKGNGRTEFRAVPGQNTLYTADDSIQGNRTVYIRGGLPNTNSRQLTFNFNTRRPGYPTQTARYDVQLNQNFGSGPITYFWAFDDSSINQITWVNDGGGTNRGNEAGHIMHGSRHFWTANGFQGGFLTRVNRMPYTISIEGGYPFQVYTKTSSYPTPLTAKPSFWLDSNSKAYLPYLTRVTSADHVVTRDSATGELRYIPMANVSGGGGASAPTIVNVSSSTTLAAPATASTTVLTDCTSGSVTHTLPSAAASTGLIYRLKKVDATANAMNVTILEGAQSITTQYAGLTIQSDGTNWIFIGGF